MEKPILASGWFWNVLNFRRIEIECSCWIPKIQGTRETSAATRPHKSAVGHDVMRRFYLEGNPNYFYLLFAIFQLLVFKK